MSHEECQCGREGGCSGGGCGNDRVIHIKPPRLAVKGVFLLAATGSLLLFAMFISEMKAFQFIGRDMPGEQTTIAVSGEGEAYASPDIAQVSFSVTQESKKATDARKTVDEKMEAIMAYLKQSGVEDKDIKTTSYSLYPKYEWQESKVTCLSYPCIQPPGKQVLTGYEVSQSVDVKVRDLDKVGDIVGGLVDKGATNMYGPNFMVDNEDGVKAKAREEAITKAKVKAEQLAKELGVSLVRIVSFNEGGDYPIYYGKGGMMEARATMSADAGAPAPAVLPMGENKYNSSVTIVYEIQ
jgi:uncharacterized protein